MKLEYLLLEETIKNVTQNNKIFYLANTGNYGDGLIRAGTLKFFRDIGINFIELNPKKQEWIIPLIEGGTVLYGGGGGWCSCWHHSADHVKKLHKRFKVIVLPSSYETNYKFPNVTFFSRDKFQSQQNVPESLFCHDMAFYLDKIEAPKGNGTGYFFRTDSESTGKISLPQTNVDISLLGNHLSPMYPFFEQISRFASIYTDRLHVAIAATLMRKEVHIFSNSYFKVKAVYESSIKDYFEDVHFHEDFSF